MKGNVTFDQVNLVSRITGEGVGRSFEGRGGLVLIKSERVWRRGFVEDLFQLIFYYFAYVQVVFLFMSTYRLAAARVAVQRTRHTNYHIQRVW